MELVLHALIVCVCVCECVCVNVKLPGQLLAAGIFFINISFGREKGRRESCLVPFPGKETVSGVSVKTDKMLKEHRII